MPLRPLDGFVVGITADRRWQEQAELLERRGASVVHGPSMTTHYLASDEALRAVTMGLIAEPPDYLVATTGIGMRAWVETAQAWGVADALLDAVRRAKVAARGPKAAAALMAAGLDVWHRSPTERLDGVIEGLLAEPLAGARVAVQQYGTASPELTGALVEAGASVVEVPVYRWLLPTDPGPATRLVEAACEGRMDAVTFTSAPAVHNLFAIAGAAGRSDDLRRAFNSSVAAACIGPVCAQGARDVGVDAPLEPAVGRLGLLVRALSDHLGSRRRTWTVDGHELVVQGASAVIDGEPASLTPQERAVLEVLAARPGVVVARSSLLAKVWGTAATDPHLLEVTIARLRRRLGPCAAAVQTRAGRGYVLAVDAVEAARPSS